MRGVWVLFVYAPRVSQAGGCEIGCVWEPALRCGVLGGYGEHVVDAVVPGGWEIGGGCVRMCVGEVGG